MPAELPAELKEIADKHRWALRDGDDGECCSCDTPEMCIESVLLAAIPIVERKTVKECCDLINGMMQSLAISRDRAEIAGRQGVAECRQSDVETCQRLIQLLSRWKMED